MTVRDAFYIAHAYSVVQIKFLRHILSRNGTAAPVCWLFGLPDGHRF